MVATKEKWKHPRPVNARKAVGQLSKRERENGTDPNKRFEECNYELGRLSESGQFEEVDKDDPMFADWQPRKKRPKHFPGGSVQLVAQEDRQPTLCPQCGWKWFSGIASNKAHNRQGFTFDSKGNQISICLLERRDQRKAKDKAQQKGNSAKRLKSNATQSAAKQPLEQPSDVTPAPEPASEPVYLPASVPPLQQSQANLVTFQEPVDVPGNVSLPCDNAEQLNESDADSSASEMTKWARDNNVDNFEEALLDFETPAEPPTEPPTEAATEQPTDQPPIQPTQPGLLPVTPANAEMIPSTGANGDLTHMGLGNNDQATLTPAEQEAVLTLVNDFFMQ